ncbi:MAG: hypothetical protein WD379_09095 [Dehalococcoidia bacterium]
MLSQHEDLYIPHDERTLRRVQRKVVDLDRQVRDWADYLVGVLPKGLALLEDEYDLLALYLASQRRRNLELDANEPEETIRTRLARFVPILAESEEDIEIEAAAHRMVATRLESDIDRATDLFCRDNGLPGLVEPVIDWRVAIRYMAQHLHHIACQLDIKRELADSPLRFELALTARDLAEEVVDKRSTMLDLFQRAPAQ